jgi:alkylation response protein AidB-like acyl-CoA dehydrogenase
MRLELTPELENFRLRARAIVNEHKPPITMRTGVRAPEPADIPALRRWNAILYETGLLGGDWPQAWGGRADHHPLEGFIAAEELARAGAPMPVGAGPLAAGAIIEFGTQAQRRAYLPRIRNGEHIWCQLFSEPGAGSDLASLQTRAQRVGDVFVVDGQKVWTTNGQHAEMGYLLARTNPQAAKHAGITAFALDMRTPGVDVRPLREITGTYDFNEVFFDAVEIPADSVIGEVDGGWRVATASLSYERHHTGGMGIALLDMLASMLELARSSQRGGVPALDNQEVRQTLGRFYAETRVNGLLNHYTQSNLLHGVPDVADAPINKIFFSELNLAMAEYGLSLQGSESVIVEGDPRAVQCGWWQDAFLYARAYTIAGGANEVLRNVIAERSLGLPREPG